MKHRDSWLALVVMAFVWRLCCPAAPPRPGQQATLPSTDDSAAPRPSVLFCRFRQQPGTLDAHRDGDCRDIQWTRLPGSSGCIYQVTMGRFGREFKRGGRFGADQGSALAEELAGWATALVQHPRGSRGPIYEFSLMDKDRSFTRRGWTQKRMPPTPLWDRRMAAITQTAWQQLPSSWPQLTGPQLLGEAEQ